MDVIDAAGVIGLKVSAMRVIEWTKSPDCRSCAFELNNTSKRSLTRIIKERHKSPKCKQCERLRESEILTGYDDNKGNIK